MASAGVGLMGTRVGRRYILLFLLAAMVPVALLAVLAYVHVRDILVAQAEVRVERMSKSVGLATLSALTRTSQAFRGVAPDSSPRASDDILVTAARFDTGFGLPRSIDQRKPARRFSDDEIAHLRRDLTLLHAVTPANEARLFMARAVDPGNLERGVLWGRINTAHLWETVDELVRGENAQFCVFESVTRQRLRCASDMTDAERVAAERLAFAVDRGSNATFDAAGGQHALLAVRDLYLRYEFGVPDWRIVIVEPSAGVLEPLRRFRRNFALTVALALVLVFLLSYRTIRRSTAPLERLRDATRRIAAGELDTAVPVESDDEFGDLGASFNGMAKALERQISLLRSLDAIDEAVLAAPDAGASIDAALSRLGAALRASRVTIARLVEPATGLLDVCHLDAREAARRRLEACLSDRERDELMQEPREIVVAGHISGRSYLPPLDGASRRAESARRRGEQLLILPLLHEQALLGVVALAYDEQVAGWSAERERARRLADRVALVLANVHLVRRLQDLSTATLSAFARAIDANSAWTAGHSERVTRVALAVGRRLGLPQDQLDTLRRGGLLHDIGKIGVPPGILDKPGALTEEEMGVMRMHPELGAQILRPLSVFADAIPIVLHHHERWDGAGYPARLAGEDIPLLARVLAIADTFDALVSHRPYRRGLTVEETVLYIRGESGRSFEPRVVAAMLAAYSAGEIVVDGATASELDLARALEHGRLREARVA